MGDKDTVLERFYRWNAPIYDLTRWVILRGRRAAVEALRLTRGGSVLELGCGTGLNFRLLRHKVGPTGKIVGVDLSAHMLARARRRQHAHLYLIRAGAARLALRTRFDAVLLAYSLTMIPNWRGALECACAHLKPGGTIVLLDFGCPGRRGALWRRVFNRYLVLNHVDTDRDFKTALGPLVSEIEQLRPTDAYATLLRGTR